MARCKSHESTCGESLTEVINSRQQSLRFGSVTTSESETRLRMDAERVLEYGSLL